MGLVVAGKTGRLLAAAAGTLGDESVKEVLALLLTAAAAGDEVDSSLLL